jgi:glutamate synthase (NADPH/NADH) small chain
MGWEKGWIKPNPPKIRTNKKIAIIGSGPSGLASAQQLNRAGHTVTVYERAEDIGGLLRFGIPDFKLDKKVLQRRINQMEEEGITFLTNVNVGEDIAIKKITETHDAILLTGGCTVPRNLDTPGRELEGVHFAMEFLTQQNKRNAGIDTSSSKAISAKNKNVVILGGGDTGSDCLGTSHRQGATNIFQFELLPEPPSTRRDEDMWPNWPLILRTSSSHEEGGERDYNILTKGFTGRNGKVEKLHGVRLEWGEPDSSGRPTMKEIKNSEFTIQADLVLLAMGFIHPERGQMITDLNIEILKLIIIK